jgi:benzoyl-CoA reductase subunit C
MSLAFEKAWEERKTIAREWKNSKGKIVGVFNSLIPEEMVHGAGILPVEIISLDKSIANSRKYLPEFLCPYLKDCLDQALEGDLDDLDGAAIAHACESLRGFYGVWKKNAGLADPFFLQIPATDGEGAKIYFLQELKSLKAYLEGISGNEITDDALHHAIAVSNENKRLLKKLYQHREKKGAVVSSTDVVNVLKARLVLPMDRHTEMLKNYLDQIENAPAAADSQEKVRLTLISNCVLESAIVSEMAEAVSGRIVNDNLCYGLRCCWEEVEDADDPMTAIAEHYLTKIPCPGKFPMDTLSDTLTSFVTKSRSEGMIWVIDKFCDPYLFQYPMLLESIQEKGIKHINLEDGDIKNSGRLRLKLEAFVEMLQSDVLVY